MTSSVTTQDRRRLAGDARRGSSSRRSYRRGALAVTIRAKLYAAIVLTILGPLATTAVALHGMSQIGDRFDEVRERAAHEAIARELKFVVTDINGWQTAYGYAGGELPRSRSWPRRRSCDANLDAADRDLTDERERGAARAARGAVRPVHGPRRGRLARLQAGEPERTRRILLGPELTPVRGDGRRRRRSSPSYEARAGRGDRGGLRRGARRRPPPPDRGRAGGGAW